MQQLLVLMHIVHFCPGAHRVAWTIQIELVAIALAHALKASHCVHILFPYVKAFSVASLADCIVTACFSSPQCSHL